MTTGQTNGDSRRNMVGLSKSLLSLAAILLLALALLQPRVGLAVPLANDNSIAAASAATACCDMGSVEACTVPGNDAIDDACVHRCAEAYTGQQPRASLPAPAPATCTGAPYTGRAVFPFQALRPNISRPAVSSTSLIYFLQRLLI